MLSRAQAIEEQLRLWRRHFHRYPELAFQEKKTAYYIAQALREMGLTAQEGVGFTGVVAEIGQGEPIVALRADMDALPMQEANEEPYASQVPAVMHACGHDAHMAMLLGAAALLSQQPPAQGRVRLLFQPSEERVDEEGKSGAMRMVEDGAMEGVQAVFGLHVDADLPVGKLRTRSGPFMAAVDPFFGAVHGVSTHAARPHQGIDPIAIASQVLNTLYAIPSRRISPIEPCIVSVGLVRGGSATNIIPNQVDIQGTLRSFSDEVRQRLRDEVRRAFSLAETLGGHYDLDIKEAYPVLINDPAMVDLLYEVGRQILGPNGVTGAELETGAEDFSILIRNAEKGGAFAWLGAAIEGDPRAHHHQRFDIDEHCLPLGVAVLAGSAYRYLVESDRL
ncbi:MAG: amidohydrolase [Chloroflexia bacterium]|nr:amidohydrolase [Chloroflexia bacterium]